MLLRRARRTQANRRGEDLHYRLAVPFADSITGAETRLTLPDGGTLDVAIPPGLVDGQVLRLKGKGAPKRGGGAGDELVRLKVMLPPGPNPELEAFVAGWGKKDFDPREGA